MLKIKDTLLIHPDTKVHETTFLDAFCVIGKGVIIERDAYISKGVKIYGKALIKAGCYIGENCIIGHPQRNLLQEIVKSKKSPTEFEGPLVSIGNGCTIRANSIIYCDVIIGDNCQTGHNVMIREKTRIGEKTLVGTNCVIDGSTTIGNNVSIQTGAYIPLNCVLRDNVFMGPYSKLTNDKYVMRKKTDLVGPTLEDFVSLGANSVVFPGVRLKERTIVGAGAIVTKNTEEKDIVVGNPAKLLKKVPEDWK